MHNADSTENTAAVRLHLEGPIFISIENFRRGQKKIPSRSAAILQLLERALAEPGRRDSTV